ncbi:aminotransferase, partial [Vibrio parahaemolyticus]
RRKIAKLYLKMISNNKVQLPAFNTEKEHVWHLFVMRVEKRRDFSSYLEREGIQTLVHYPIPPHHQVAYEDLHDKELPITE